jgi:membrane-anchored glycerophosphoryl diester phosphodiesterase (GDPDase)
MASDYPFGIFKLIFVLFLVAHLLPYTEHHMTREKRGRQRTTRRRIIISELEEMVFFMGQAQYIAKDIGRWRQIIDALCPIGDEEDK